MHDSDQELSTGQMPVQKGEEKRKEEELIIKEAHIKTTELGKMLRIAGNDNYYWFSDNILDYVREHKEAKCRLIYKGDNVVTVELVEEGKE
jgi:hypothetical protein